MMVQSTIDKIKDTTIMRMLRKLCGFFDELVGRVTDDETKIQENTDMINNNKDAIEKNKVSITKNSMDIATNASNITANGDKIQSLRDANILIVKDIEGIKEVDTEQNSKINTCYNDVTLEGTDLTFATVNGGSKTIIIPSSGGTVDDRVDKCFNDVTISGNELTLKAVGGTSKTIELPSSGGTSIEIVQIKLTSASRETAYSYLNNIVGDNTYYGCISLFYAGTNTTINLTFNKMYKTSDVIILDGSGVVIKSSGTESAYGLQIQPEATGTTTGIKVQSQDLDGFVSSNYISAVTIDGFIIKQ